MTYHKLDWIFLFLLRREGFVYAISLLNFSHILPGMCVCVFYPSQIVTEIYDLEIPSNVSWRFFFLLRVSSFYIYSIFFICFHHNPGSRP